MFFASFLELFSLGMILPITSVFLGDSNSVYTDFFKNSYLFNYFNSDTLIIFLFIFFTIYLFKIAILLFIFWYQQKKILHNLKYNLSNKFYFNYITEIILFIKIKIQLAL